MPLLDPPVENMPDGQRRRVGVELEFSNLDCEAASQVVASMFGGEAEWKDSHRIQLKNSEIGDFTIELDMAMAHAADKQKEETDRILPADIDAALSDALGSLGTLWLPTEVVCPPLAYDQLEKLDDLVAALRKAGATGTYAGLLSAFGTHLNPEVPDESTDYIVPVLQAYLVLSAWLRAEIGVDVKRRATPFIDPFPTRYVRKVLAASYAPSMSELIDDFLLDNPTRSRELDMLPLFKHLDRDRVESRLQDHRINARPTFHYRLPNCDLDNPDWSLKKEWNRWVRVERLAADPQRLAEARAAYLDHLDSFFSVDWATKAKTWAEFD